MVVSNRKFLFQGSIFRCYVSFREGISRFLYCTSFQKKKKTNLWPSPNYILSWKPTNQPTRPAQSIFGGHTKVRACDVADTSHQGKGVSHQGCEEDRHQAASLQLESRGGFQGTITNGTPTTMGPTGPRDPRDPMPYNHVSKGFKNGSVKAGTHIPLGIRNWEVGWVIGLPCPWNSLENPHWFVRVWVTYRDVSYKMSWTPNLPLVFFQRGLNRLFE